MFVYWQGRVRPGQVMRQAVSTLDLTATIAQVSSPQPQPPTANPHPPTPPPNTPTPTTPPPHHPPLTTQTPDPNPNPSPSPSPDPSPSAIQAAGMHELPSEHFDGVSLLPYLLLDGHEAPSA